LLDALIEEEVVLIAREAIVNAFTHAGAAHISVCLSFVLSSLRVTISDDGVGIPEEFLKAGQRSEHWGLLGMRERAAKIHAELDIRSRIPGGTRIDLKVPGAIAYAGDREQRPNALWNLFRRRAVATEDVALK
jgi:signal transduction histidine kinase